MAKDNSKAGTSGTLRARENFLKQLAENCNVADAARVAGVPRRTVYNWRSADPEFAKAWEDAEQEAADKLEAEAWKRATVDKSDRMLEILLKAHRPDKFVEKRLIGSDPAHPLPPAISIDARQLSTETLREVTKALQAKP